MAKKFDIHKWQAQQWLKNQLNEQDNFIPDLEDDDLKRAKIQQMMNTEKGLQKDDYKLVNSISNVADMYSYGEILDALESFYIKNDEQPFAEMARKHAKEFRDFLDSEDELDEASTTGTGTSFTAGSGEGYMSPYAFGNNKRKKKKGYMGYKEINEAHGLDKEDINTLKSFLKTHLSKDKDPEVYKVLQFVIDSNIEVDQTKDLSKQTNEQEEPEEKEYVKDVEKVSNLPALDKVNTKAEWEDMMQLAFDMADDITQVQDAHKRMWLQNTLKSLNKA